MKKLFIVLLLILAVKTQAQEDVSSYFDQEEFWKPNTVLNDELTIYSKKIVPKSFYNIFNLNDNTVNVIPYFSFPVYENFTGFVLDVTQSDGDQEMTDLYLIILDKNLKFISKTILKPRKLNDFEESGFAIDDAYDIYDVEKVENHFQFYDVKDDCAAQRWTSDVYDVPHKKAYIQKDGKIKMYDSYLALQTVRKYLDYINEKKFKKAYALTKNPNWGTEEHFCSTKGFGGISYVEIYELKYDSGDEKTKKIFCRASYFDPVNGDSYLLQKFILNRIIGKWIITGMKILDFGRRRNYTEREGNIKDLEMRFDDITKKGFRFKIEALSYDKCKQINDSDEERNPYLLIQGDAKYSSPVKAEFKAGKCSLQFNFSDKKGTKLSFKAVNCKDKYKNIDMILNKTFEIRK